MKSMVACIFIGILGIVVAIAVMMNPEMNHVQRAVGWFLMVWGMLIAILAIRGILRRRRLARLRQRGYWG